MVRYKGLGPLILALCGWLCLGWSPEAAATVEELARENPSRIFLLPRVGVALEYGGFILNKANEASRLRREVELDMLRLGPHLLYVEFREVTRVGVPGNPWEFDRVEYLMALPGYRYDLGEHYVGVLADHWCLNNFKSSALQGSGTGRSFASIYLLTLEFLDKGSLIGQKDRGIVFDATRPFEWLGRWHYRAQAGWAFARDPEAVGLQWALKGEVRLDLCRYRRLVPYVTAGSEVWVGPSWRFFPWGEVGVRWHAGDRVNLIPFLSGGRRPELYQPPQPAAPLQRQAKGYLYGGVRLEASLEPPREEGRAPAGWQLLPELHGTAGYAWLLHSRDYGFSGGIDFYLEVLRREPWTWFLYGGLQLATKKSDLSLLKARYWLEYGLTYTREPFFAEALMAHSRRYDTDNGDYPPEGANLAGVRLGTRGMKPGQINRGITFDTPGFKWLGLPHAQLTAGHYFLNRNWQYLWQVKADGRVDLARYYRVVLYGAGEVAWLKGGGATDDAVHYAGEAGLRIHGDFDLSVYYRFQHQPDARNFRGPADNQSLVGVKAVF
uniref:Uncharacterized protein n=1 Tax=Desulfobacca acetoxidans TaxID=60893 RepID=A0A7V4G8P1_9BACT